MDISSAVKSGKRVIFYVPPKVHILDLSGPAHVFFELSTFKINYEIIYCSSYKNVISTSNMNINQFIDFNKIEPLITDIIIVPGCAIDTILSDDFKKESKLFLNWIKKACDIGARICSVCTGAFILGQAGILNQINCTTHWKYIQLFKRMFPKARIRKDELYVIDKNIYTSAGVSTGIDLALYLIEEIHGIVLATEICKEMVVYMRRDPKNSQKSIYFNHRNHMKSDIHEVQNYIMANLEKKISLSDLAILVNYSERNLTRLFKKTIGCSIFKYITSLRREKAVTLYESTNLTTLNIAKECGFKSPNQLRNILGTHE